MLMDGAESFETNYSKARVVQINQIDKVYYDHVFLNSKINIWVFEIESLSNRRRRQRNQQMSTDKYINAKKFKLIYSIKWPGNLSIELWTIFSMNCAIIRFNFFQFSIKLYIVG